MVVGGSAFVRIWLVLAGNRFESTQLRPSVWHLVEPDRLAANPLAPLWDVHTRTVVCTTVISVVADAFENGRFRSPSTRW
jgi:hypothetical protein